jgi:putative transposase
MERACAKLDIRLLFAKPYAAESKGKIERFNRTIDNFLTEIRVEKPESLTELNRKFWVWLDECYLHRPHSSLEDNMSPIVAYNNDKEPLRFLDTEQIAEAFLRIEERKVDKSGCISFNGEKYEIENGLLLIGRKVNVIYERSDTEHLWIEHENFPRTTAKPLVIGERAGQRPPLPQTIEKQTVSKSRLLDAAEKINQDRDKVRKGAISFRIMGGDTNV